MATRVPLGLASPRSRVPRLPRGQFPIFATPVVAILLATSCATSSEPYSVSVKNDLGQSVTLAVCSSPDCSKRVDPWVLKRGQTGGVNVEVEGGYNSAILLGSGQTVIGCLPFRLSKRPNGGLTVNASSAVPCGSSGGTDAVHGAEWPSPGP